MSFLNDVMVLEERVKLFVTTVLILCKRNRDIMEEEG